MPFVAQRQLHVNRRLSGLMPVVNRDTSFDYILSYRAVEEQ
jgi:hypothetical protein